MDDAAGRERSAPVVLSEIWHKGLVISWLNCRPTITATRNNTRHTCHWPLTSATFDRFTIRLFLSCLTNDLNVTNAEKLRHFLGGFGCLWQFKRSPAPGFCSAGSQLDALWNRDLIIVHVTAYSFTSEMKVISNDCWDRSLAWCMKQ